MSMQPDGEAFCQQLVAEYPKLFANVNESIRDDVLRYPQFNTRWIREVREVLAESWSDGPEAAVRDAVTELSACVKDYLYELYDHGYNEWLTHDQRAEYDRQGEIAWALCAELSAASLAALIRAASGARPPEA